MKETKFFLFFIICMSFVMCKPYDSNEVNKKLLQGRWKLIDSNYPNKDSIKIDYKKEITYLVFQDTQCTEYLNSAKDTNYYKFNIDDYNLILSKDSNLIGKLEIMALSKDSLVLGGQNTFYRKYVKVSN